MFLGGGLNFAWERAPSGLAKLAGMPRLLSAMNTGLALLMVASVVLSLIHANL